MKKYLFPLVLILLLVLSACGGKNETAGQTDGSKTAAAGTASATDKEDQAAAGSETGTVTYQSETGPVEIPANPQRVVDLSSYTGTLLKLGVPVVGVDQWTKANPNFQDQLANATEVSADDIEKIIELQPDLILASSDVKNADKLKQIAPLVTYTYNKVDYLTQIEEVSKAVNKGDEGAAWVEDFKTRAEAAGKEIKAKIGEDKTVTVMEGDAKQLYIFGDAWGRGTEVLYQAMGLKMPDKVKEMTSKDGYYDLSLEVLPEYLGDYVIFSKTLTGDNSFQDTDTYKNIPAVKAGHVYEVDATGFYFNDALSLDYQLDFIKKSFLGE
ncbi:iron-hydroxamate ABC transporter substrate-binding protein [Saccharibacillus sp. CPCC 101409]|uniref:iron-hydroxamate ABC transporter substrate-binding protein n=1 Tax=Saccharibacillus sp. CPCC 101409 TaxID=3058041 RepID=UPI002671EA11|nr:iron-hydroxamate ABC transporter substrate-binding protein [Saccharibacillus sp. CPCC 101409]MDO3408787.1 iron-hydroxamate ABC transporter substrate-binding protein [Saccharibacillus sp. CPCC 101409]